MRHAAALAFLTYGCSLNGASSGDDLFKKEGGYQYDVAQCNGGAKNSVCAKVISQQFSVTAPDYFTNEWKGSDLAAVIEAEWNTLSFQDWDMHASENLQAPMPRILRYRRHGIFVLKTLGSEIVEDPSYVGNPPFTQLYLGENRTRQFPNLSSSFRTSLELRHIIKRALYSYPIANKNAVPSVTAGGDGNASKPRQWVVGVHQLRVFAGRVFPGEATPEWVHRDGFEFVSTIFAGRSENAIYGGESNLFTKEDAPSVTSFENRGEEEAKAVYREAMTETLEALHIDDYRMRHSVSTFSSDDGQEAYRDVLVLVFRKGPLPNSCQGLSS